MKKLIIAAAMMAGAIAASASTVTWGAGTADTIDADKITSGTFYLMYASGTIDLSKFNNQKSFSTTTLASAGFDTMIDSFSYDGAKFQNKNNAITPTSTELAAGSYDMYGILIGDADSKGVQYLAIYTDPKSVKIAAVAGQNQSKTSADFTYYKTAAAAPEPTSGLLLLLGMAGLALKRKRA